MIIVYDTKKNPINFLRVVNLMDDELRNKIGFASPQDMFDNYLKICGTDFDYSPALIPIMAT